MMGKLFGALPLQYRVEIASSYGEEVSHNDDEVVESWNNLTDME